MTRAPDLPRDAVATGPLELAFQGPYATAGLLAALDAHAVPDLEVCDVVSRTHTRVVPAPHGPLLVTAHLGDAAVTVTMRRDDGALTNDDERHVVEVVRRWLDLDADPAAIVAAFGGDATLGPLVTARPGLRVLGSIDGFETAVLTVLGQQVSVAAGRTFGGRLVAAYGGPAPTGFRAFPTPASLAATTPEELQRTIGVTHARSRTLHALAGACADGLRIHPDEDHLDVRRRLLALPGIGPWTVDYLALRVLGDRDAYPAGDLVLQRTLGARTASQAAARAERWRPWRAYAASHLWTDAAYGDRHRTGQRSRMPGHGDGG